MWCSTQIISQEVRSGSLLANTMLVGEVWIFPNIKCTVRLVRINFLKKKHDTQKSRKNYWKYEMLVQIQAWFTRLEKDLWAEKRMKNASFLSTRWTQVQELWTSLSTAPAWPEWISKRRMRVMKYARVLTLFRNCCYCIQSNALF